MRTIEFKSVISENTGGETTTGLMLRGAGIGARAVMRGQN